MRKEKQALKRQLLAAYERQLDDVLVRLDDDTPLNLDEIEAMALKTRAEVGQVLSQALAESETQASPQLPVCPHCQQAMHDKGQKRKVIRTRCGDIPIQRPYCDCNRCRKGLFPPGGGLA